MSFSFLYAIEIYITRPFPLKIEKNFKRRKHYQNFLDFLKTVDESLTGRANASDFSALYRTVYRTVPQKILLNLLQSHFI
jgi:hypothetical protein